MIRYIKWGVILAVLMLNACTSGFEELWKNPNGIQSAQPKNFISPVLYQYTVINLRQAYVVGNELMQYTIAKSSNRFVQRYDIRPAFGESFWDNHYIECNNVQDMLNKAEELNDPNYTAIALVLKALIISQLTDTFGDIPYTEALQSLGDEVNFLPKYNTQQDIYTDMLANLDRAALMFNNSAGMSSDGDLLYAGNVTRWRKFCNSLRLRLYMRVSKRPEMNSAQKIAEIVNSPTVYPIFINNAEQAYLPFSGVAPFYNPYYNTASADFGNRKAPSQFLVSELSVRGDGRLDAWFAKTLTEFTGAPAGYPLGMDIGSTSILRNSFRTSPKLGMILSYAEVQFILAEAAMLGWIDGGDAQAKIYYENGIKASMDFWDVSMPASYLTQLGVAYDGQLSTIMLQKYFSLFFVGQEAWYEYRRTGYPVLPIHIEANNNGKMPRRLLYPLSTQRYNKSNYDEAVSRIGGDNINVRCWWEN